jgi:hypothetical protein
MELAAAYGTPAALALHRDPALLVQGGVLRGIGLDNVEVESCGEIENVRPRREMLPEAAILSSMERQGEG